MSAWKALHSQGGVVGEGGPKPFPEVLLGHTAAKKRELSEKLMRTFSGAMERPEPFQTKSLFHQMIESENSQNAAAQSLSQEANAGLCRYSWEFHAMRMCITTLPVDEVDERALPFSAAAPIAADFLGLSSRGVKKQWGRGRSATYGGEFERTMGPSLASATKDPLVLLTQLNLAATKFPRLVPESGRTVGPKQSRGKNGASFCAKRLFHTST